MNGWLGRWREKEKEEGISEGGKDGGPSIYLSSFCPFIHSFVLKARVKCVYII